jgi:hypothetical protein
MAGTGAAGDCRDHSAKRGSHRVHAVYNTFIPRGPTRENGNENADIGFRAGDGGSNSANGIALPARNFHPLNSSSCPSMPLIAAFASSSWRMPSAVHPMPATRR